MQDSPDPIEILEAVARTIRETVMPEVSGHAAYAARVAANAVDLVSRQIRLQPDSDKNERERLVMLLKREGSLSELNAALCDAIEAGTVSTVQADLHHHLWATTKEKLAVDQPKYAAYRRLLSNESSD